MHVTVYIIGTVAQLEHATLRGAVRLSVGRGLVQFQMDTVEQHSVKQRVLVVTLAGIPLLEQDSVILPAVPPVVRFARMMDVVDRSGLLMVQLVISVHQLLGFGDHVTPTHTLEQEVVPITMFAMA